MAKRARDAFYEKFIVGENGCWIWQGSKQGKGYGLFRSREIESAKLMKAHRASWIIHKSAIPPGMSVCHRCDNPSCVNPDHLFLGTHLENMMDRDEKGRTIRGTGIGISKLTDQSVRQMRKLREGGAKLRELAAMFGVNHTVCLKAIKRETWSHVE